MKKKKEDGVSEALKRLRENNMKTSIEITDGIFNSEATRAKSLYESYKTNKTTIFEMLNPSLDTNKDKSHENKQSYNAVKKRVHEEFK